MNVVGSITDGEKKTAVISYTLVLLRKGTASGGLRGLRMLDRNDFVYVICPGVSVFLTACLKTARTRQVFHHFVQGVCGVSKLVLLRLFIPPF